MAARRWWLSLLILALLLSGCGGSPGTAGVALNAVDPTGTPGASAPAPTAGVTPAGTPTIALVATPTGTIALLITATPPRGDGGLWSSAGTMGKARLAHTATLLADGRVLVVGGAANLSAADSLLNRAELYSPTTNSWADTGDPSLARGNHTATLLADGRVVIIGGRVPDSTGQRWQATANAEVFNGSTSNWQSLAAAPTARSQHTAVLLPNGTILVVGGLTGDQQTAQSTASAELYDPATNTWTSVGSLTKARHGHTATLLADGRVLVTGGESRVANGATELTASAEIYDPESRTWSSTGSLAMGRQGHTATLLADGRVLVVGGETSLTRGDGVTRVAAFSAGLAAPAATAELYDPRGRAWQPAADLPVERAAHTATLLPGGQVLIVGGYGANDQPTGTALRYDPAANRWQSVAGPTARAEHTATLLPDGSVLVAGGRNGGTATATAERYFPQGVVPTFASPSPSPSAEPTGTPAPSVAPAPVAPTNTPTRPPTATRTPTPVQPVAPPPTATPTNTPVPPTATATNTPRPTNTPTPTNTPIPPTNTPTNTPRPPTNTPTNTPIPLGGVNGVASFCVYGQCAPEGGIAVSVAGKSTTSGANGGYAISGITPGTYTIVAAYQGYRTSASVTIVGGRTATVNLTIQGPVVR